MHGFWAVHVHLLPPLWSNLQTLWSKTKSRTCCTSRFHFIREQITIGLDYLPGFRKASIHTISFTWWQRFGTAFLSFPEPDSLWCYFFCLSLHRLGFFSFCVFLSLNSSLYFSSFHLFTNQLVPYFKFFLIHYSFYPFYYFLPFFLLSVFSFILFSLFLCFSSTASLSSLSVIFFMEIVVFCEKEHIQHRWDLKFSNRRKTQTKNDETLLSAKKQAISTSCELIQFLS